MTEAGTSANQRPEHDAAKSAQGESVAGKVVMLSGDLMFASRVRAAAQGKGLAFHFGSSLPEGDLSLVCYVILDLSTRSGLVDSIAGMCAERCPQAKLLAYGPHVQVDLLRRAREAGVATVMTNGQFHTMLPQLF
jgi:hypothetical protein